VLALLAKPSAITVPLMAGLIGCLVLGCPMKAVVTSLAPWGLLCLGLFFVTHSAQPVTTAIVTPVWTRPFIVGDALAFDLSKLVWPTRLGIDYGRSPVWLMTQSWAYFTGLIPLTLGVFAWVGRSRYPVLAAAFGIITAALLPTLGLTPFVFQIYSTVADRYQYLAVFGLAFASGGGECLRGGFTALCSGQQPSNALLTEQHRVIHAGPAC
jgi:hypothetical protein